MRWLLKRWWFWAGALLLSVAIADGYFLFPPVGNDRITQANFDRIQDGMTFEEVIGILGYADQSVHGYSLTWISGRIEITVWFKNKKVRDKSITFESAWESLRRNANTWLRDLRR